MGGPSVPETTTQINKVELPAWVDSASQDNYQFAKEITDKPLQQYSGQTVAGLSPITTDAYSAFKGSDGGSGSWSSATGALTGLQGQTTPNVTAGQLADTDLSKYMNPYIDNVEKTALGALDRSRVQSLMSNADKAKAAGAFGGSRSAVVDGVTNAQSAIGAGDLSAKLRSDAFNTAVNEANTDIGRKYTADTANQSAELANRSLKANAAGTLASVGDSQEKKRLTDLATGMQMGQQDQSVNQKMLDADLAKFTEAKDYDLNNLNTRLAALGMSPYGKTETQTKTNSGGGGTDFASVGLGFMSLLPALFGMSDEKSKTDIEFAGTDPGSGLDLYAYRYKGDPKNYPKVVGPMAQDIEKVSPGSVTTLKGKNGRKGRKIVLGMGRPIGGING